MAPVGIVSRGRVFHGWYIVTVAAITGAASGIASYSFGLFFNPMRDSLGWSRTAISLALTIRAVTGMFISPVYGPIVDRKHGAMILMVGGGVVLGVALVLTSQVTQLWQFYLLMGVAYGMSVAALSPQVVTPTVIAKWFIRMRGRAIAIVSLGHNAAAIFFVPLTAFIIVNFGWRDAWFFLGIVGFILVVPLSALFVRRTPEDVGLLPDGREPSDSSGTPELYSRPDLATEHDWTLREAARTPALWLIVVGFTISGAGLGGFLPHVIPTLTDKGYSTAVATALLTLFSIVVVPTKMIWGILGERVQVRYLIAVSYFAATATMLVMVLVDSGPFILLFPVFYAMGGGGYAPLSSLMWANYFGRGSLGTIRGVFLPVTQAIGAVSPVFAGYVFDTTDSYDLAFLFFGLCFSVGGVTMLLAKRPAAPSRRVAQGASP